MKTKIELHHGDCMDAMKDMEDNQFDLAIVDPPYGIGESGKTNKSRGKLAIAKDYKSFHGDDLVPASKDYFSEFFRISKNQIIWGANHFIEQFNKNSRCWIVWDKNNGSSDFADCELAWTSFNTAVRKFEFTWNGMLQGNMKNKEKRIHPTQKPVQVYKWLLRNYAKEGDKILDTHLGSGSIAVACWDLKFDLTGYELDKEYYDAGMKRFDTHCKQGQLF